LHFTVNDAAEIVKYCVTVRNVNYNKIYPYIRGPKTLRFPLAVLVVPDFQPSE